MAAKTKHRKKSCGRKVKDPYPNLIFSTWDTVDRPRQVIVSGMTAFWTRTRCFELALYFDAFTKQIVGHGLTKKRGCNGIYYKGLRQAVDAIDEAKVKTMEKLEVGCGDITLIHTDQGSVYTSKAYNEIIKEHNIVRSCSRAGKPTDNPVNESLNGWIKEELCTDFDLYNQNEWQVERLVEDCIEWYNSECPCCSLGYKTPDEFYEQFMDGDIECKDTFKDRVLDERPKFLRQKLESAERSAENGLIGTSGILLG